MTQHYDRALRKSGLRATQFNTLIVLAKAGPMPMAGLAEFMGMDRTSLTRNLQPPCAEEVDQDRAGRGGSARPHGVDHAGRDGGAPKGGACMAKGAGRCRGDTRSVGHSKVTG